MGNKNIFIITPVRNITEQFRDCVDSYVNMLEGQGNQVHYPPRDTPQQDRTGLRICQCNLSAIQNADEVHIAWDGDSRGSLFDLGMAFALDKKIVPIVGLFPKDTTPKKSFAAMVYEWSERTGGIDVLV